MLLNELVLVENVAAKLSYSHSGYVNAKNGEVLEQPPGLSHVAVLGLYPEKFNLPPELRNQIPDSGERQKFFDWVNRNDSMWGFWQRVLYDRGWVRFGFWGNEINFSGYATSILAVLSIPDVAKDIIRRGRNREYGITLDIDVLDPRETQGKLSAVTVSVRTATNLIAAKEQLSRMAQA